MLEKRLRKLERAMMDTRVQVELQAISHQQSAKVTGVLSERVAGVGTELTKLVGELEAVSQGLAGLSAAAGQQAELSAGIVSSLSDAVDAVGFLTEDADSLEAQISENRRRIERLEEAS